MDKKWPQTNRTERSATFAILDSFVFKGVLMHQREQVSSFSELKDLLIRTFQIERDRAFVKLHFSENGTELLMHDYDDHKKALALSRDMMNLDIREGLNGFFIS